MKRAKDLFGHPLRATREDAIHAGIVEFLCFAAHPKLLFFHPVNGALVKPSARMYFARLGVFPGVADLVLVLPGNTPSRAKYIRALGFTSPPFGQ